jgi:POT family proton-dependent oligopeptide transporter
LSATFYLGLLLIVVGTGLLKPNISVIVGQLYHQKDIRRDAAFSLFYMGINLGAFLGPIITGFLVQEPWFRAKLVAWGMDPNSASHWGFGAAGVGMTLGLVQYVLGWKYLGSAGLRPTTADSPPEFAKAKKQAVTYVGIGIATLVVIGVLMGTGVFVPTENVVTVVFSALLFTVTAALFTSLFRRAEWTRVERGRLVMIGVYFVAAALFWSVFEQAGSTLNLFARDYTIGDGQRVNIAPMWGDFPIVWWQSLNAVLIVLIAPLYALMWVRLGTSQPSTPTKFALGFIGVGLGFLWLVPAANITLTGAKVGVIWLFDPIGQIYKGHFPGSENVPGANDFSSFQNGVAYFFALLGPGTVTWTTIGTN